MNRTSKSSLTLAALTLSALGLCFASVSAQAAPFVYEPFSYGTGNIANINNTPPTGLGAWAGGNDQITAGSLTYTDSAGRSLTSSGNKVVTDGNDGGAFSALSPTVQTALNGTSTYYLSVLISNTSATNNGSYAGLSLFNNNGTNNAEQLFVGKNGGGATTYGMNVYQSNGGTNYGSTVSGSSTVTHLLVTEYQALGGGKANVYFFIDPTLGATPDISTAASSALNQNAFSANNVRIQGGGSAVYNFDEFRIGTTYADVAPAPEPSQCAALGLGLVGLGGLVLRARRRNAASISA